MENNKALDDMSIPELEQVIDRLLSETWEHEWQYQFTKEEVREIRMMINKKQEADFVWKS